MTQVCPTCQTPREIFSTRSLANTLLLVQKSEPLLHRGQRRGPAHNSLTMTYFHTGICTIIGAKAFHGPVRDGKEWDHLAMVVRHNGLLDCLMRKQSNEFIESYQLLIALDSKHVFIEMITADVP